MIVSNNITTEQNSYTTQSSAKENGSGFDEVLQSKQASESPSAETAEVQFKMIERMSYEYIKGIDVKNMDEVYGDLSEEEQSKIATLHHISNMSDNETLNKTLFNKAQKMTSREAMDFYFQKASEQYHYKTTGSGERFLVNTNMFQQGSDGKYRLKEDMQNYSPDEYRLSHKEAFDMLIDMIQSSKEGMQSSTGELQKQYEDVFNEYSELLGFYNNELRHSITGAKNI